MPALHTDTLADARPGVIQPGYDPADVTIGIVHFGPGAFHRAHQAWYISQLLATDPRWGIAAVSLRSRETVESLAAQDGAYTVAEIAEAPRYHLVAPHRAWLAAEDAEAIVALIADPNVRLVTSTVTEKGYCLDSNGTLDPAHPDIVHDLDDVPAPHSLAGWLVAGLAARAAADGPPITILCCDNMAHNGHKLGAAVRAFAGLKAPALLPWIAANTAFPDSMVDSITPATDEALIARVSEATGLDDAIPVGREPFVQWVVQDVMAAGAPDLASVGVTMAADVAPFEQAKLRILNGAHSTLAYIGLLQGHESVAAAMTDADLVAFVDAMIRDEIIPTLAVVDGFDLQAYADAILDRFRNPAIHHKLSQIAWDGSQKLPYRLLDAIAVNQTAGRSSARLIRAVAAWIAFLTRQTQAGAKIVDPLAERLSDLVQAGDTPRARADRVVKDSGVFPASLREDADFRAALQEAAEALG